MTIRSVSTVLIVALCIFAGQRAVSTQTAPGPYFIADLGTLGGAESRALGLSARGLETVGSASRTDNSVHAFVFVKTMTDLGTLGGASSAATGVNRAGTVVGRAQVASGNNRAFAYTPATGMRSLGTLGGSQSEAVAINDAGRHLRHFRYRRQRRQAGLHLPQRRHVGARRHLRRHEQRVPPLPTKARRSSAGRRRPVTRQCTRSSTAAGR